MTNGESLAAKHENAARDLERFIQQSEQGKVGNTKPLLKKMQEARQAIIEAIDNPSERTCEFVQSGGSYNSHTCNKCDTFFGQDDVGYMAKYCPECRCKVVARPVKNWKQILCPKCGGYYSVEKNYCPNCIAKIIEAGDSDDV